MRRWHFPKRINTILAVGILLSVLLLPLYVKSGVSAVSIKAQLIILAVLIILRLTVVQHQLGALPPLLSQIRWGEMARTPMLRATMVPLCCVLMITFLTETPLWLGEVSLALVFTALLGVNHCFKNKIVRTLGFSLSLIIVLFFIWVLYFDILVAPIGIESMEAVFQTDLREAWQFITANTDSRFVELTIVLLVCTMLVFVRSIILSFSPSATSDHSGEQQLMLFVVAALLIISSEELSARMVRMSSTFQASVASFQKEKERFTGTRELFAEAEDIETEGTAPNIVVYIGESTTRHHMGLYGYPRDTTPFLSSVKNEIVVFRDAVAPHSNTTRALREAMTDLNFDGHAGLTLTARHPENLPEYPYNIIDVLNASGMRTWWLSNHNQYGIWDNPVTNIAEKAQQNRFFRKSVGKSFDTFYFDDYMVKEAVDLIRDTRATASRAIFIHSYAGHSDYCSNIPEPWRTQLSAEWSPAAYFGDFAGNLEQVDCYDSAIRYVDQNLYKVIEALKASSKPMILLYFSDHGEDVDDGSGHNSEQHSYQHLAVPLVLFFNDAARERYPSMLKRLQRNANQPFEISDIYHLLASLAQVKGDFLDATRAPSSDTYQARPRNVLSRGMHWLALDSGSQPWGHDLRDSVEKAQAKLRLLKDTDRQKLSIHHVNSLAKLREAELLVSGVEFDAVFDQKTSSFRIYHPPDPDTGLDLDTYLSWAGTLRLWMDLKNLSEDNYVQAFDALTKLNEEYAIRERLIVEIGADFLETRANSTQFLQATKDWQLSLYLPTEQGLSCRDPALTISPECVLLERLIADTVYQFGFKYISFDAELSPWVSDSAKLSKLPYLTWNFGEIIQRSNMFFLKQDLFQKSEVFLVPIESRYSSGQFDCCDNAAYK